MASQNFYTKSLRDHPDHIQHIVPTQASHDYVDVLTADKKRIKKLDSHKVVAQNKQMLNVQASTSVPAGLLNGGQIDCRLEKGIVDLLDYCLLRITLQNNTGGNVVLAPSQLLVNRIDVYADNGSTLLNQIYGLEMFLGNMYLGRNEFENSNATLGLNNDYAPLGTVIANGSVVVLYVPVYQPFHPARLHPNALSGQLLIRTLFNAQALTHVSGGLISCTDFQLVVKGRDQVDQIASRQAENYYLGIPLSLSFSNIQRMSHSMVLAPSSTYSFVLSGIKGICSVFSFVVRASGYTAATVTTLQEIQDFDIQNSSGDSMIGFYRRTKSDQLIDYSETFDNLFRKNINFNYVSFSTQPVLDYSTGSNHGYTSFNSFEKLSFSTPSTLVGGTFIIDVVAFCHDSLRITKGRVSATRN